MWNVKYDTNELIYEPETIPQRADLWLTKGTSRQETEGWGV